MRYYILKYCPALSAFVLMISFSMSTTALSFLNQPAATELGVGMGSFTVYYSLFMLTGGLLSPVIGQMIGKYGVKKIILISAFWVCFCLMLFSAASSLWMFYAIGVGMGLLSTSAMNLIANVMLPMYYSSTEAASLVGIVVSGSGVGSILFSTILPRVIETMGWRGACRVLGLMWMVLLLIGFLLIGNIKPLAVKNDNSEQSQGMTRAEAIRHPSLYLQFAAVILLMFGTGLIQHFPAMLAEKQFSLEEAGAVIGFYGAVLTIGKILQGFLYGKLGVVKGGTITHVIFLLGLVMIFNAKLVYPAFSALAIGIGIMSTITPIITKQIFGMKEFGGILGIIMLGSTIGSFISTPVWGFVFDYTGSYNACFPIMAVIVVIAFGLQIAAIQFAKNKSK